MNAQKLRLALVGLTSASLLLMGAAGANASNPTVSIESLTPGTNISVGTNVSFAVATTGFINPIYSVNDTFVDGSLGNIDLNSAGEFSWTPEVNDVGTHTVTITVSDNSGDEATAVVTLTVAGNGTSLSIGSIYPSSTVTNGQTVSFSTAAAGFSGTPTYTVSDSFTGSTVSDTDINTSGQFSWIPAASDVGAHTITLTATDSSDHTAHELVTIEVESSGATVASEVTTPAVTSTDSSASSVPVFTEDLTLGSSDAQVTALQQVLTTEGDFSGPVTGYFGTLTQAAVTKFQAAHDIEQLGIVGPATREALNALAPTTTTPTASVSTTSTSGATITQIQTEVESVSAELTQIESQLSALIGQ